MKNHLLFVGFMVYSIIINGCKTNENQTVIGTGDVVSIDVNVPEFHGVAVNGTCNVDIQIGESQSVRLYAQQEILDVMTCYSSEGILQIGFDPDVTTNTDKEIRAEITVASCSFVSIVGAGDFKLSGPRQSYLDIYITGAGNVDAYDMNVDECAISISGMGNCKVWVNNGLDVEISGVGIIYYKGDPVIKSNISGTGSINKSNN